MKLCCLAILVNTLLVLCVPLLLGEKENKDGDVEAKGGVGQIIAIVLTMIKYIGMILLYSCTMGVIVGAVTMTPEDCIKDKDIAKRVSTVVPPVSAAMVCTINLTIQFFVVKLFHEILVTVYDFLKPKLWFMLFDQKYQAIMSTAHTAAGTVEFAPMLCILFLGARMRAMQLDPVNGSPQWWAKWAFYICAYAVLAQTIFVLLVPICGAAAAKGIPQIKAGSADGVLAVFH